MECCVERERQVETNMRGAVDGHYIQRREETAPTAARARGAIRVEADEGCLAALMLGLATVAAVEEGLASVTLAVLVTGSGTARTTGPGRTAASAMGCLPILPEPIMTIWWS